MAEKKAKRAKRPGEGRPTKYKPEYCQAIIAHFDVEPVDEREIPHYDAKGNVAWTDIKQLPQRVPSLTKFAKNNDLGWSTVHDWLNKDHASYHVEFSDAYTHARAIRRDMLIDMGMMGLSPPAAYKFTAVNLTEMRDKQETELNGNITVIMDN